VVRSGQTLDVPLIAALAGVIRTAWTALLGTARVAAVCGILVGVARSLRGPGAGGGRCGRDRRAAVLRGAADVPTRGRGLGGKVARYYAHCELWEKERLVTAVWMEVKC